MFWVREPPLFRWTLVHCSSSSQLSHKSEQWLPFCSLRCSFSSQTFFGSATRGGSATCHTESAWEQSRLLRFCIFEVAGAELRRQKTRWIWLGQDGKLIETVRFGLKRRFFLCPQNKSTTDYLSIFSISSGLKLIGDLEVLFWDESFPIESASAGLTPAAVSREGDGLEVGPSTGWSGDRNRWLMMTAAQTIACSRLHCWTVNEVPGGASFGSLSRLKCDACDVTLEGLCLCKCWGPCLKGRPANNSRSQRDCAKSGTWEVLFVRKPQIVAFRLLLLTSPLCHAR